MVLFIDFHVYIQTIGYFDLNKCGPLYHTLSYLMLQFVPYQKAITFHYLHFLIVILILKQHESLICTICN